jgi:hypothetical protein
MRLVELIRRSDAARALPDASPDVEVERSVCDRLYGDRAQVTATPLAHGAAPLGRLVGATDWSSVSVRAAWRSS